MSLGARLGEMVERAAPGLAARYWRQRIRVDTAKRLYEAAEPSQYHPRRHGASGADLAMARGGVRLRSHARYLDENHDLAIGVLDTLVNRVIGEGLEVEPMVRDTGGRLIEPVNERLADLFRRWGEDPEVTGEYPWGELCRLTCRGWLRDGEIFAHHVEGAAPYRFPGRIPYALELLEADFVPYELIARQPIVVHGVEKNQWGRAIAYWVYKEHPEDVMFRGRFEQTKRVPAEAIVHLKFTRRVHQTRGVSLLHGALLRFDDLKEYEESERIAARVAAAMCAVIKKAPELRAPVTPGQRDPMEMEPGMIMDDLLPGEDVELVGAARPNPQLGEFRADQLRAIAAGTGTTYSTISKRYEGSYSSQRQEMVESAPAYGRLRELYIARFARRIYRRWVLMATLAGAVDLPAGVDAETLGDAMYHGPGMPWIDQLKEMQAQALAVEQGFASRVGVIREHGGDPRAIDRERAQDEFAPPRPAASPADDPAGDDEADDTEGEDEQSANDEAAA